MDGQHLVGLPVQTRIDLCKVFDARRDKLRQGMALGHALEKALGINIDSFAVGVCADLNLQRHDGDAVALDHGRVDELCGAIGNDPNFSRHNQLCLDINRWIKVISSSRLPKPTPPAAIIENSCCSPAFVRISTAGSSIFIVFLISAIWLNGMSMVSACECSLRIKTTRWSVTIRRRWYSLRAAAVAAVVRP